ncbi:MAG: hypothetical protein AAB557_06550 [Patescibacteria group bacterium]
MQYRNSIGIIVIVLLSLFLFGTPSLAATATPAKQKAQIDQARAVAVQNVDPIVPPNLIVPPVQNVDPIVPPKGNISLATKLTAPLGRVFSWLVDAWTGGIMMVWNPVAGAIGKIMKR